MSRKMMVVALTLVGCGYSEAELAEGNGRDSDTGSMSQGLGEMQCATAPFDALIDHNLDPGDVASVHVRTSADNKYDHSAEGCPRQFIVEVRQTRYRNLSIIGGWGDTPPSSSMCAAARVEVGVYGYANTQWGPMWVKLGTEKRHGSWEPGFLGQYYCAFLKDADSGSIPELPNSTYQKIRVAARAYYQTSFGPSHVKAEGGVMSHY